MPISFCQPWDNNFAQIIHMPIPIWSTLGQPFCTDYPHAHFLSSTLGQQLYADYSHAHFLLVNLGITILHRLTICPFRLVNVRRTILLRLFPCPFPWCHEKLKDSNLNSLPIIFTFNHRSDEIRVVNFVTVCEMTDRLKRVSYSAVSLSQKKALTH